MAKLKLKVTLNKNGSIKASWSKVSGAVRYEAMVYPFGQNTAVYYQKNLTTTSCTTKSGLAANKKYKVTVSAYSSTKLLDSEGGQVLIPADFYNNVPLAVPQNVKATADAASVTVSFDKVERATGYDILFDSTTYSVMATSKKITGLQPKSSHTYAVRAKNASQTGAYSTKKTITTLPQTPAVPTGITKSSTESMVTIGWRAVSGATGYTLLFRGSSYNVAGTSKTFTGLTANTDYTFQVCAKNADASSAYSAVQTVRTTPKAPATTGMKGVSSENLVTITWDAVPGATGYDVLFNGKVYSVSGTSVTISGLTANTNYQYQIRVKNGNGTSSYSGSKTVRTTPNYPTSVSVTPSKTSVTLYWSPVSGAQGYDILFNGQTYRTYGYSYTINGLTPGTSYTYSIRTNNSDGSSSYSAPKTVTTIPNPPEIPTNVTAVSTTDSATVSWSAVSSAAEYDLWFGNSLYTVTGTSKTITGLMDDTSYTYKVCARNAGGTSAYSAQQTIRTKLKPPAVPVITSAVSGPYTITLRWDSVKGAEEYDVLVGRLSQTVKETIALTSNLAPSTVYTYQVRARNAAGVSAYTAQKSIRTRLAVPSNISADVKADTIELSWNTVNGASGYEIDFNGTVYSVTGLSKKFTGLTPKTEYTYAVRAKNSYVTSAYSKKKTVSTLRAVPGIPENVTAVSETDSVIVSWDAVADADNYDVNFDGEIYPVEDHAQVFSVRSLMSWKPEGHYLAVYDLEPDTIHSFCVRANNESGSGSYSTEQSISTKISRESGFPDNGCGRKKSYPDGRIPYTGMDPVNALTGAFLWSYTFLEDYGKDALHFTVMYDSKRDSRSKVLGNKWAHAFQYSLRMDKKYAYFTTPGGDVIPFHRNMEEDTFQAVEGIPSNYRLWKTDAVTYCVKETDGTKIYFDENLHLSHMVEGGIRTVTFLSDSKGQITRIEGRHGGSLTLSYKNGHISQVSNALGHAVSFTYDGNKLAAAENPSGNRMTFTYDKGSKLLEITDFSGETYIRNRYDKQGRVIAQNMAGRGESTAAYNEEEKVTVFTDELGNETKYYYDENSHITMVETEAGSVKSKYNETGQVTEQIDALGHVTQMTYDEAGRMNQITYPDGSKEQVIYNDRNYPVKVMNRDGSENLYEYDARNNLTAATDERGNTCTYVYDDKDNLITYVDKNGGYWKYFYDADNHLEKAEDPAGNLYQYIHDAIGRLVSYTAPTGKTTAYQYAETGELLQAADAEGTVVFEYNANGNNIGLTDKRGNRKQSEYNELGQLLLTTDFRGNEYRFAYDEKGNLAAETDPLGYQQKYTYDARGNRTTWTNPNGETTAYTFNAASQLTEVKDAAGNLTQYVYDTVGRVTAVTDALQHQTSYAYDACGRITSVTNALGYRISYIYDRAGNLLSKTDENGSVMEYTYDKENRLSSIKSESGTVHFIYDKLGRVITVQDTDEYSENISYDGDGNVTEYTDKEGHSISYIYDEAGRLSEEINPDGSKTVYTYDANGNCISILDAEGNEYHYEYDADNHRTKEINPLGYETVYEYDARGYLQSVTDARGGKNVFEYDGNGNCVKEINPLGGVMTYTYDSLNRLIKSEDEEGHKRTFTYDACGNLTSAVDANENCWNYEYNAVNRLTSVTDGNGGCLALDYTKTGKIAKVTDWEGAETNYRYDAAGRLLEMSDALEHKVSFTYDSQGRVLTQTDANGNTTEFSYTPTGRLLSVKEPEGNTTTYTYDALGRLQTAANALGNVTSYEYDALGRVLSITDALEGRTVFTYTADGNIAGVTDANGNTSSYQYDACGNLTRITDALGNTAVFEYDAMNNQIKEYLSASGEPFCTTIYQYDKKGQRIKEINPLSAERMYTYDAEGNVASVLDEDGNKTEIRYDLNNRPTAICYSDGKEALFRYNKRGELVELKDWNGTAAMEYDRAGRLLKVTDHNARVTGYGYDANGNITSITYPDGSTVTYTFDKNNRMTCAAETEENMTQYAYNPVGNILSVSQPGSTAAYTYNAKGLPEKAEYQFEGGAYMEECFSYDAIGHILRADRLGNVPGFTKNTAYTYDALGQLTSWTEGEQTTSYSYDSLGNRVSESVNDTIKASCRYNGMNQLTAMTVGNVLYSYGYDKRGNLTEEKRGDSLIKQYLYDATGHLSAGRNLESGETTEYGYNGLFMRIKNVQKLQNGTREIQYVPDFLSEVNNELLAYETGISETRAVYGRGYERLEQKVTRYTENTPTAVSSRFQHDIRGSVLFAADVQGNLLQYAERGVWGSLMTPIQEELKASGAADGIRFTNYCYDPVIEKYFAQERFYDAGQGRMLSVDPVKRGLNGYPYCQNDPVNYADPNGKLAHIAAAGLAGGLGGGIFGLAESVVTQLVNGEKVSLKKAAGHALKEAAAGAGYAMLATSGVGLLGSMATNFATGMGGTMLEQLVSTGNINVRESAVNGLTNAVSSAILGKTPFSSLKSAVWRNAGAGAATAGIDYLAELQRNGNTGMNGGAASGLAGLEGLYPYIGGNDPRSGCGTKNPLAGAQRGTAYGYRGYRYDIPAKAEQQKRNGFSLKDFILEAAGGGVTGGFLGAAGYGAGKAVRAVVGSFRNRQKGVNNKRVDFYVTPEGTGVPATGYRYSARNVSVIQSARKGNIVARNDGMYFSFDKIDDAIVAQGKLQIPYRPEYRIGFDTLEVIDDINIPSGKWGKASYLEPITKDYRQFGPGGATQVVTYSPIDSVKEIYKLR